MIDRTEQDIKKKNWVTDSEPLVSVCCTTFNHQDFIGEAIDGFLMQETNFPFEIIVRDDCSTDKTASIVQAYAKKFPSIIKPIFEKENTFSKGVRPMPSVVERAAGKYLAVCEGDDYWTDPLKLKIQVGFLEKHPDYVVSGHDAFIIDDKGNKVKDSKLPDIHKRDYSACELAAGKAWILTMSWVYRNVIDELAPERNMVRNGDTFLTSILGGYGKSHYHHEIKPAAYRVHSGSIWSSLDLESKQDEHINTWFWMYRYYKRLGNKKLANLYHSKFMNAVVGGATIFELLTWVFKNLFQKVKMFVKNLLGPSLTIKVKKVMRKFTL